MARKAKEENFEEVVETHDEETAVDLPPVEAGFQRIRCQGRFITVRAPYTEGYVLNAAEANALNGLRAENVRNNVAGLMKKLAEGEDAREMTDEEIAEYDSSYDFSRRQRTSISVDPVGAEERKLAKATVVTALKRQGLKPADVDKDQLEAYVNRAVESGRFRDAAVNIVQQRASLGEDFTLAA